MTTDELFADANANANANASADTTDVPSTEHVVRRGRPSHSTSDQEGYKTCLMCRKELPIESFYRCGTSYLSRCKECVSIGKKATTLYRKGSLLHPSHWPEDLQGVLSYLLECRDAGGRLDYSDSSALLVLNAYDAALVTSNDNDNSNCDGDASMQGCVSTESISGIGAGLDQYSAAALLRKISLFEEQLKTAMGTIADLQLQVHSLSRTQKLHDKKLHDLGDAAAQQRVDSTELLKILKNTGSSLNAVATINNFTKKPKSEAYAAQELQERNNAMKRLVKDEYLQETMGEEFDEFVQYLQEALISMDSNNGALLPDYVVSLIRLLETNSVSIARSEALTKIYGKFLRHGLLTTLELPEDIAQQYVESAAQRLCDLNYYRLDWMGIPYIKD